MKTQVKKLETNQYLNHFAVLNIGLQQSKQMIDNPEKIKMLEVFDKLKKLGIDWESVKIGESSSEETAIVVCSDSANNPDFENKINLLSRLLCQEAIAVYYGRQQIGALIGEFAENWGTFAPKEFLI